MNGNIRVQMCFKETWLELTGSGAMSSEAEVPLETYQDDTGRAGTEQEYLVLFFTRTRHSSFCPVSFVLGS